MNPTPGEHARLRQLMDACRADSDDLSLVELADLAAALRQDTSLRSEWESRQRSERVVRVAMHDVTIPPGLAERILSAAATRNEQPLTEAASAAVATEAEPASAQVAIATPPAMASRFSRRRLWQLGIGVAVVLVLCAAALPFLPRQPPVVSADQLAGAAREWFKEAVKPNHIWQQPTARAPITFPAHAVSWQPVGWQQMAVPDEPIMVVYDLGGSRYSGHVFLFAAKTRKKYEVSAVPFEKLPASGGFVMGAWKQGDMLYVLVVEEPNLHLEQILKKPRLG